MQTSGQMVESASLLVRRVEMVKLLLRVSNNHCAQVDIVDICSLCSPGKQYNTFTKLVTLFTRHVVAIGETDCRCKVMPLTFWLDPKI